MYDASVKVPTGIEYGEVYQFGNFDQCMTLSDYAKNANKHHQPQQQQQNGPNDEYDTVVSDSSDGDDTTVVDDTNFNRIKPKYCLADVIVDGFNVQIQATRHFEVGSI